ncbi:hypothetical protein CspHIS471_0510330 [Cutaneotrichosporon sp. HIS471]|nr:hypothetical protein CspHIS471_0510330 [Cutaneotrichosporon sp. HIS471]
MQDPRDQPRDIARSRYSPPDRSPGEAPHSIPIPNHYNGGSLERSPRPPPSPSSSRSPSQSSLNSYRDRAHPYSQYQRRSSVTQGGEDRFLPPPNSSAPLHVLHEGRRRSGSDEERHPHHERTHSYDREREREWRDHRPPLVRAQSDNRGGAYNLPPISSLHSASSSSSPSGYPLTPTSNGAAPPPGAPMGPPSVPHPTSPDGSRATSPRPSLGPLRPSYHTYESSSQRPGLGLQNCYRTEHSPPRYDRERERDLAPPPPPPPPPRSPPRAYHQVQYQDYHGRARSHSAASALNRYPPQAPPRTPASESEWAPSPSAKQYPSPGTGQNRRLAHLMSEQKRRESINTGFQSLRNALPSAIPTDSKAIILRKAVSHIKQLEEAMRKHGINLADVEEDEPMREATGGVNGLHVDMDAKYDSMHVEDVSIERERKPAI